MRNLRFLMPVGSLLVITIFIIMVMLLWNWLMPVLFGLVAISFWQAAGLFIFVRILFGGFGFNKGIGHWMMHDHHHKNPIHDKWMKMSPEQREEFINKRRQFGFGHPFGRNHFYTEKQDEQGKENE
ncbi:MAG: hypothetical protein LBL90_09435 [Prevotellaceae bacterium]|nr:hypothetical protein [Prevotellaceae bacterium]